MSYKPAKEVLNKVKRGIRITAAVLAAVVAAGVPAAVISRDGVSVTASSYDSKISSLEAKQKELEQKNAQRAKEINAVQGDLEDNQEYIDKVKEQISGVQEQISTYNQLITAKTSAIEAKSLEIAKTTTAIAEKEKDITDHESKIAELERENDDNLEKFGELMHAMYLNSGEDIISVLMGSRDFYDLLVRTQVVKNISKRNVEFMDELKADIARLDSEKTALTASKQELEGTKSGLETERESLRGEESKLETDKSVYDKQAKERGGELEVYVSKSTKLKESIQNKQYEIGENEKQMAEFQSQLEELIRLKQAEAKLKAEQERKAAEEAKKKAEEAKRLAEEAAKKSAAAEASSIAEASRSAAAAGSFYEPPETLATTAYSGEEPDIPDYTEPPIYAASGMEWPMGPECNIISAPFGYSVTYGTTMHYGIDIVGPTGTTLGKPIKAAQSGTVLIAFNDGAYHNGYGNYVVIDHGGGITTLYGHCASTTVKEGQTVKKGDVVGYVGMTGRTDGPHLHFEVRVNGKATDPINYVSKP